METLSRILGVTLLASSVQVALLLAQASYEGQIRGTVTDPAGAVVPSATVTLVDTTTNIPAVQKTDNHGGFTFNGLRPGNFDLLIESSGFRRYEAKDLKLAVSQAAVVNVKLEIGTVTSSIEVKESVPLLDTGSAAIGTTISGASTRDVPLYGRSYFGLVFLAGGVTSRPVPESPTVIPRARTSSRTASATLRPKYGSMVLLPALRNKAKAPTPTSTISHPSK